jgi:transcriptional regulator, gntR family
MPGGSFLNIIISNNRDKPIYEQIIAQIKNMIMSGELVAGESLPSMRALAKSIHVSVITVQKAYEELQRDGFIETEIGRGTYVLARNKEFYKEQQQKKMEEYLQLAIEVAKENAISLEKMIEILKILHVEE